MPQVDSDLEAVITPVSIAIESETENYELGPRAREALRIEQVQALRETLDGIVDYHGDRLLKLNRAQLEDLGRWLDAARRAVSAIWWLIPDDVYTADEDDE